MTELFVTLLNMSIAASWTILAVLLLRPLLRKAPKWITCLLWAIPALRLLIPVFRESALSLVPSSQVIPANIAQAETPIINSGLSEIDSAVNPVLTRQAHSLSGILQFAVTAWIIGLGVMLLYSLISWLYLRYTVRASLRYRDRVYLCDEVKSPFIFGILFPGIYLPSGLDEGTMTHVLAHENAHLKRFDHLWKPLGYLLLTVYWFNPLLWVAYILLCRDIERACDEKVLRDVDESVKKEYAKALVDCSTHRRMILTCPIAFGEVSVKSRVKAVLSYKKPAVWIVVLAFLAGIVTSVCFLTSPKACAHNYQSSITLSATCTKRGNETFTCTKCGHSYMAMVQPCDHNYGVPAVLAPSDCANHGSEELTCLDCGFTTVRTLPLAENIHDLRTSVTAEATCCAAGEITTACSRCSYATHQPTQLIEHTFRQQKLEKATCVKDGKQVMRCTLCGLEETIILRATGNHRYANGSAYCSDCGIADDNRYAFFQGNGSGLLSDVVGSTPQGPQWPVIEWDLRP